MRVVPSFRAQAELQGKELLRSIEAAEGVIVSTIDRECEALRAGRMLAANALRLRLSDAATLYLNVVKLGRASIWALEHAFPGMGELLEERRSAFASLLKIELAVLSAERTVAENALRFAAAARATRSPSPRVRTTRTRRVRHRRAS